MTGTLSTSPARRLTAQLLIGVLLTASVLMTNVEPASA